VLEDIAGKNGWDGNDEEVLANASINDYYTLFKSKKGRHLGTWVNNCIKFDRFAKASD
jgi:hypothetical protein